MSSSLRSKSCQSSASPWLASLTCQRALGDELLASISTVDPQFKRVGTSNSWPVDENSSPKVPSGSPGFRRKGPLPTPRQQPSLSPSLRAAALTVANGGGKAAVGFLKGCSPQEDMPSQNYERSWASVDGAAIVDIEGSQPFSQSDVVAPATPPTGAHRPSRLKVKRSSFIVAAPVAIENERCSCCTKEEFWIIYDVFASMDRRHEESVRRSDFLWALGAHGARVEFQRVVRRSRLTAYFKSTVRDISLEEFVRRILPNANAFDVMKMLRWVSLRKARNLVLDFEFRANREQLKQVFSLLEEACSGTICATELLRAQILTRTELLSLSATPQLTFEQFLESAAPVLADKYVEQENRLQLNQTSRFDASNPWDDLSQNLKKEFGKRASFAFPFVDIPHEDAGGGLLHFATPEQSPVAAVVPLPAATVAALIRGLSSTPPASPMGERCMADLEDSPVRGPHDMRGMEQSPMISAF